MLIERYEAAMVLGAVGDSMGYRNNKWESCTDGEKIHEDLKLMGGLPNLIIKPPEWRVSDDTVMHLATAEALIATKGLPREEVFTSLAWKYIECMKDMDGRSPGRTTVAALDIVQRNTGAVFWQVPFNARSGGCGAAMRSMCIGLCYPRPSQLVDLIAVSIESGRITHHQPTGYLGGLAAALFTAYALQGMPLAEWGAALVGTVLPLAKEYVRLEGRYVKENLDAWSHFGTSWERYVELRQIGVRQHGPVFPAVYDFRKREEFYKSVSWGGHGGASGHDSVIIAYDALLGCNANWTELCERATLHGGDNDSTGSIASSWFGALYGYKTVLPCHHEAVEYRDRLVCCARELYGLNWKDQ